MQTVLDDMIRRSSSCDRNYNIGQVAKAVCLRGNLDFLSSIAVVQFEDKENEVSRKISGALHNLPGGTYKKAY